MVDYVKGMTADNSCEHGKYGLFDHLLHLVSHLYDSEQETIPGSSHSGWMPDHLTITAVHLLNTYTCVKLSVHVIVF